MYHTNVKDYAVSLYHGTGNDLSSRRHRYYRTKNQQNEAAIQISLLLPYLFCPMIAWFQRLSIIYCFHRLRSSDLITTTVGPGSWKNWNKSRFDSLMEYVPPWLPSFHADRRAQALSRFVYEIWPCLNHFNWALISRPMKAYHAYFRTFSEKSPARGIFQTHNGLMSNFCYGLHGINITIYWFWTVLTA